MGKRIEGGDEFKGAEFVGTNLEGLRIEEANMAGARFKNVFMRDAVFKEALLVGATIEGDLSGATINGLDFGTMYINEMLRLYPERTRLYPNDPAGYADALTYIEEERARTFERLEPLSEDQLQQRTSDGEWSVVENLRHLLMAESSWALRTAFDEADPVHPLALPPDFARDFWVSLGFDPDVTPSYAEVREAMHAHHDRVRVRFGALTQEELDSPCTDRAPGYPPDFDGEVSRALLTYLHHEWDHHRIIERVVEDVA